MFNVETIAESIRRHWVAIVLITLACLVLGLVMSLKDSESEGGTIEQHYTAETVLYVENSGYSAETSIGQIYNFYPSEYYLMADLRRVVVGDAVAGELRKKYGEDVEVRSPRWVNEKTREEYNTHFVFIDVTTNDSQASLDYAAEAAELTVRYAMDKLSVKSIVVTEEAYLRTGDAEKAVDWGTAAFVDENQPVSEVPSLEISKKTLTIYAFVGLFGSVFCFAAYDILSRRMRSAKDVERMTSLNVLSSFGPNDSVVRLANALEVLQRQHGFGSCVIAGASEGDGAAALAKRLSEKTAVPLSAVDLATDEEAQKILAASDCVLLAFACAASSGAQIEEALKQLKLAGIPVVGAVFQKKK